MRNRHLWCVLLLLSCPSLVAAASVRLLWDAPTTGGAPDTYVIERRIGTTGAWITLGVVAATERAWSDTTVQPGTTYGYQVSAQNVAGTSAPSNLVSLHVPTPPGPPLNMRGTLAP